MRRLGLLALVFATMNGVGCSMCCSPYDNEYATYGGRIPRADQVNGRVGSPFSDPSMKLASYEDETSEVEEVYVPPVTSGVSTTRQSDEPMEIDQDDFDTPLQFE